MLFRSGQHSTWYLPISLTDITIRGGYLHYQAFRNCQYIKSINVVATSSTVIRSNTFQGCTRLTDIVLPATPIQYIDNMAFYQCGSLVNMTLPFVGYGRESWGYNYEYNLFGYIFGTSSYTGAGLNYQQYNYGSDNPGAYPIINGGSSSYYRPYYIPNSLRKIVILGGNVAWGAFSNLVNVTDIRLPDTAYNTDSNATRLRYTFYGCRNLERVYIPTSNIQNISPYTFYGCFNLKEITLPFIGYQRNYTTNNANARFAYVFSQSYYNNSYTPDSYYYTDANGWRIPKSLAKITILGNSNIYNSAFDGLKYVKEINLPNQIGRAHV